MCEDDMFKSMIGKKLVKVSLDDDRSGITFELQDSPSKSFHVKGECCSHSWIEHLEMPGDVAGATLLSVLESAPVEQDHNEHDEENGGDSIRVYNTKFRTDRGDIVLEYRNSSNGYYGGYLVEG